MNDRKTNEIHCVPKNQADAFLSYHSQMPTNLNKITYTCRQVNCQTSVNKRVTKLWLLANCHSITRKMLNPGCNSRKLRITIFCCHTSNVSVAFYAIRLQAQIYLSNVQNIDVKNVFYVFYFKIKNAFFNVFLFSQRFLLIKKNVGQQFQL